MDRGGRLRAIRESSCTQAAGARRRLPRARSRRSRPTAVAAVCGLLSVLVLAGCGSSSSSSSTANSTFVAEANGACRTAYAKVNALRPTNAGQETAHEVAANLPKIAVIAQAMLGRLTALTPPASQQVEYNKMLSAWRNEISLALVRGQAATKGDTKRLDATQTQLVKLAREFDASASKLSLTVCAANP